MSLPLPGNILAFAPDPTGACTVTVDGRTWPVFGWAVVVAANDTNPARRDTATRRLSRDTSVEPVVLHDGRPVTVSGLGGGLVWTVTAKG